MDADALLVVLHRHLSAKWWIYLEVVQETMDSPIYVWPLCRIVRIVRDDRRRAATADSNATLEVFNGLIRGVITNCNGLNHRIEIQNPRPLAEF